jgi:hypothetical protein
MLALVVLAAALPSLLCLGSAAFLAYKERSQWVWFAALSIITGWGGVWMLNMIGVWRLAAYG